MTRYDTVVLGGTVVFPGHGTIRCDLGLRDGRIAAVADGLDPGDADEAIDARGLHVFPGGVDSHMHFGIYRDLSTDVASETESSLVGGATTALSYFRTGHHYLNRSGPYREILPEVLDATDGRAHVDYGYHLAPMTSGQLDEIDWLVGEAGVASFKYYMFYKGLNLAGDSEDADAFTMSDDKYDFGHLYAMMENVAAADARHGGSGRVSLSLHCENAELIKLFMARTQAAGIEGARAWHEARPPLTERLSVHEAAILADATRCRVNLLHLSSAEALRAALEVRNLYPSLDVRCETTLHHLVLTHDMLDGTGGKVNPPIRTRLDVEALWDGVARGDVDWVASDHACCMESQKGDDVWPALPGFGGTALLYPVMLSEGAHKRGLPLERIAELVSAAPARAYGCFPRKGSLAVGADADLVLVDLQREQVVTPDLLHSAQDHTPFQGVRVKGWPVRTLLRGATAYRDGEVVGQAAGRFLRRPAVAPEARAAV
ncbi:MAG TPA: dihydroorotase family protein [Gaiellaceae bacterium]